jgi:hypothetical protein
MLLDDAPKKYTKQVHFRLQTAHLTPARIEALGLLASGHPGSCPFFLCFMRPAGEIIFVQAHENNRVTPSRRLQEAVDEEFGEGTYYAKVDSALPEKQSRRWERKPDAGNGDGE